MAQRYCTNCGAQLREDDRFCPSCGRPAYETAAVSTPEADVRVPPPPGQQQSWETASTTSQQGTQPPRRSTANKLIIFGCAGLGLIGVLVLLVVGLAVVAGSGGGSADRAAPSGGESQGTAETFTNDNYSRLFSDPRAHKGASVDVTGQLLERPEDYKDELAFQMFADIENADWNTIVYTDQTGLDLDTDDYVRVQGEVLGAFEGENAFGGGITAPSVQASKVSVVSAGQAIDSAEKVVQVDQTLENQGFQVTLDKIEFGQESTRAYVTLTNNTGRGASFYTFDAKIVQGSMQADYLEDSYAYYDEEPQSELRPGIETQGVVPFEPVDSDTPFELRVPWSSDNYNITAKPVTFQVTP